MRSRKAEAAADAQLPRVGWPALRAGSGGLALRIEYLLETAPLFGGVKVVLAQANLLARVGHQVRLVCSGEKPAWYELDSSIEWLEPAHRSAGAVDVTVATYWTTLGPAMVDATAPVVHYCQGFEGSYTHNRADHDHIARSYELPAPAFCVSEPLARLIRRRFRRPARVITQPLEDWFGPDESRRSPSPSSFRVVVVGPLEIDWKGVATALEAVARLRASGREVELIRISQTDTRMKEAAIAGSDEFHTGVTPREVAAILRGCDVLLTASWEQEGFGLPALEAMASGVPVVASRVRCYEDWAARAALIVDADPTEMAAAVGRLADSPALWCERRQLGLETAREYSPARSTQSTVDALEWVRSGNWKSARELLAG